MALMKLPFAATAGLLIQPQEVQVKTGDAEALCVGTRTLKRLAFVAASIIARRSLLRADRDAEKGVFWPTVTHYSG
jgi:hypothetical protein